MLTAPDIVGTAHAGRATNGNQSIEETASVDHLRRRTPPRYISWGKGSRDAQGPRVNCKEKKKTVGGKSRQKSIVILKHDIGTT